jgi:type II secretory ATPase GspE/PulE/Tfp pilus assembly ATPase PilB-like protein
MLSFDDTIRYRVILTAINAETATVASPRPLSSFEAVLSTRLRRSIEHQHVSDEEFNNLLAATYPQEARKTYTPESPRGEDGDARNELLRIFDEAHRLHVTDIHFERAMDGTGRIRMRQDRMLLDSLAKSVTLEKIDAYLRILRHEAKAKSEVLAGAGARLHLPSDIDIDIRLQFFPGIRGDEAAARILGAGIREYKLYELGIPAKIFNVYDTILRQRQRGHLLIGPLNAGKSTTMRAVATHVEDTIRKTYRNKAGAKIVSAEAPVELRQDYSQIEIDPATGVSYDILVSKLVRMDYDLAIVGEVNDSITARVFFDAALAGRMLAGSFHANDSISAILRLLTMDIPAMTLQAALGSVLYQRLLPKTCEECSEDQLMPADLKKRLLRIFGEAPNTYKQSTYDPKCPSCKGLGTVGLHAVFELLPIAGRVRQALGEPVISYELLYEAAVKDADEADGGFLPIEISALVAVMSGKVSWAAAQEVCTLV